jgi:predicted permease
LLLGIAAFNVFLLLLARTLERSTELALRAALGASRRRLLGVCAAQGLVLSAIGGVLGIALAPLLLAGVLAFGELELPTYVSAWPSPLALLASFAVLAPVAVIASLLPAWQALRRDPATAISGGARNLGRDAGRSAWQRALVATQIGLATALLTGAAALGQAWFALDGSDLGFATDDRLRIGLFVNAEDVAETSALPAFVDRLDQGLRAQPGVRDIAWVWPTIPIIDPVAMPVEHPALQTASGETALAAGGYVIRPGFFAALEIPLLAGRDFGRGDHADAARVAIVSASLAARLGGVTQALDVAIGVGGTPQRIVGVVDDTRFGGAAERSGHAHELYLHYDQSPRRLISPVLQLAGDPATLAPALVRALAQQAPASAIDWVGPVDDFAGWLIREDRFRFMVVGLIALSALLLAAAGLYGLMSQQVLRRTREIGLRKALGARDGAILARQLLSATAITGSGLLVGGLLAFALGSLLRSRIPGIAAIDPPALLAVAALLFAVAIAASVTPAWRAARITPMEALREQ